MQTEISVESQLKNAAQIAEAGWAALAERAGGAWALLASYRLSRAAQNELLSLTARSSVDAWLCGALSGGYPRFASIAKDAQLGVKRLFVFPIPGASQALLVGADKQSARARQVWKLTASLLSSKFAPQHQPLLPDLQSGLATDLPLAIEKILHTFVQTSNCLGAWMAIRRGETLDIQAQWNDPAAKNVSLQIDANPILRRVHRSLKEAVVSRGQPNWDHLPHGSLNPNHVWVCLPLTMGQRLIGVTALWRAKEFSRAELGQLRELAERVSPSVEALITFSEMGAHLRRLGLLNDFVLTVSSAQNLEQIARRMFGLLARAFNTELIALFLLSTDGRMLRDYRMFGSKMSVVNAPLAGHSMQSVLEGGRARRVVDATREGVVPIHKGARSLLIIPLRYRGRSTGALVIESPRPEAFSQYDEHLMGVITSHLAGLIEYVRLREEAEGRARSLALMHEVVQQVIGLQDKKQVASIAADLVARYFKYELALILLKEGDERFSVQGVGGSRAETLREALAGVEFVRGDGVAGAVLQSGKSLLLGDVRRSEIYKPIQGWEARSELCVALKDGENILGVIDIESGEENAFSHNDLLAMESLAGILAAVIASANQYEKLQETITQLRAAEIEVNRRMEAQRAAENKLLQAAKLAAVGEMAAGVAHELNNPLTTVIGFVELIFNEMQPGSPNYQEMSLVLAEARRASGVVRRLLDFSRQGERARARSDLNELVYDVVALTQHLLRSNDVTLSLALDGDLPWLVMDVDLMKQVLLNLVHNALQAMPSGGFLQISTYPVERDGARWAALEVKDTGVGIKKEDLGRVFEPFFTTRAERGGTGLGLSVTYGIVKDHGGDLEVASEPGKGSVFTVSLPIES